MAEIAAHAASTAIRNRGLSSIEYMVTDHGTLDDSGISTEIEAVVPTASYFHFFKLLQFILHFSILQWLDFFKCTIDNE